MKSLFEVVARCLKFAWQTNRQYFLLLIILNVFQGSVAYLQLTSFARIVNEIILINQNKASVESLIFISITLGLSFLIPFIIGNVANFYLVKFKLKQTVAFELYRIEKQSALDIGTIESSEYQNLLRGAKEWGTGSVFTIQDFVFTSASCFAGILTSIAILWSLNPWLVLFASLASAPIYFFYKKYSLEVFRVRWLSVDDTRIISNRISHFEEVGKTVDTILLKLKDIFKKQIQTRIEEYSFKVVVAERKKAISYAFLNVWYLIFLFAAIALMTINTLNGSIAVGGLLLAFTTYTRFYTTINGYIESISHTEEAARYAARWFELFELKPKLTSNENSERFNFTESPIIEFRNVSFSYADNGVENPVLKNISFIIKPGQKIAIVGINGSGKTTLIKLLCRIYDPIAGVILVNGKNLKDINLRDWQATLGVLFQDFPLYNMSVRDSIAIGRMSELWDEDRLQRAARDSGASEFINMLPNKYDQLIWKGFKSGTDLSKGQHQRMAVARMFFRKAVITILDEPTASIDAMTEEIIFTTLEENTEGKTVILITHRFSTVQNADQIILLDHGEIIEHGSHKSLIELHGRYEELYTMQARRYREHQEK